jgi:hypothetical protein
MQASRLVIAFAALLAPLGIGTVGAESGSVLQLRFTQQYIRYSCALQKLEATAPDVSDTSERAQKQLGRHLDAVEALEKKYKSAIEMPYPTELRGYKPKAFELVELLWTGGPSWPSCVHQPDEDRLKLRRDFRCPLERLILIDRRTGRKFTAVAAFVDFDFVYERTEEDPRPLPAEPNEIIGNVILKGEFKGKTYRLNRSWTGGAPSETLASSLWEREDDEKLPSEWRQDLPVVTARNASLFVFDLKNEPPYNREQGIGGSLKEYRFEPFACRAGLVR